MKFYKAFNKRIIPRASNGRFRASTLGDIGGGCCEICGKLYGLDFSEARVGQFIDPLKMNQIKRLCPECREK